MYATIDAGGRIVVPKAIRERLGLEPGTAVELTERDGMLEISVRPTPMRLVDGPHGPVAVAERPMPILTAEAVRDVMERTRR